MKHETLDPGFLTGFKTAKLPPPTDWSMGTLGTDTATVKSGFIDLNPIWLGSSATNITNANLWSNPELIETNVLDSSVELIYKQVYLVSNSWQTPSRRALKIIFSCIDGKWNKSEPVYGEIISAQEEYYTFNHEN